MGIAEWLVNLGIRAESAVAQVGTMAGIVPLAWPAGPRQSLVFRLPRDPHQRASIFARQQMILVSEGEEAVVLEDGVSNGALPPGRYLFEKTRVTGALDIVWVSTGSQTMRWGVGNVLTTDGIQISANGVLYVRVDDSRRFNAQVLQGAMVLGEVDLQRFLLPRVQGVLRALIAKWPALELQAQRETFDDAVRASLGEVLGALGLGVVSFEVVEIALPPEFKRMVAQGALATHGGRAALIEASTRAQITQLEAAANAQAQLTSGMAQVQLMAQMQAQGLDPMKLKALEALNTFAANPAQGLVVGGDAARAQLFGAVAGAALAVPAMVALGTSSVAAAPPPALPSASAASQPAANGEAPRETVESLEHQLDALTDKLANGTLSEDTFNMLAARIAAKVTRLRGDGV
jgi:regulator of protease activity HflC (stomatin/prohibitin superfamily)